MTLLTKEGKYKKADMQQENKGAPPGQDKTANFSMTVLWLTQFAIVTLNILLGILFVLAKKDFCGSVYETRVGE